METKRKVGETTGLIYRVLRRNPGLTTGEIASLLPELDAAKVQVAISRMRSRGEVEVRGKKEVVTPSGRVAPYNSYHVKYKVRHKPKPSLRRVKMSTAQSAPKVEAPVVEAPKVVRPAPENSVAPVAEREVLVLRHLSDIYKAMNTMTEQQDQLIQVLKGTLADLAETKEELDAVREARGFWATVKGWFA